MTATLSKADLRTAALAKRDALSDEQRAAAAQAMAKRGLPFAIEPGMVVSGYSPIRSEIDPAPLMRKLAEQGAKLALPAVMARGKSLAFRAWSPDDRLMMGPLGILEPSPAAAELIPDIMLVPLAAFDREGHRIGYGAGHYDFTLAHLRKVKAITAVGTRILVAGNKSRSRAAARRGAGLCANGKESVRFPELNFAYSLRWRRGRPGRPHRDRGISARHGQRLALDLVVVNGENSAGGFGITEAIYQEFLDAGADAVTLGNHAWDQREALVFIERAPKLIRPANFPRGTPGRGAALVDTKNGKRALVVNAIGRVFMTPFDDPFAALNRELEACPLREAADAIVVDFHGEASSEKQGIGFFCDGRASLVVGTHTHVPTADHQILAGGTAYMTDAGMTGDYDSIIGMQKEEPLRRFTTGIPSGRFEPAAGVATLSGVAVETDDSTGLALRVAPVRNGGRLEPATPGFWAS